MAQEPSYAKRLPFVLSAEMQESFEVLCGAGHSFGTTTTTPALRYVTHLVANLPREHILRDPRYVNAKGENEEKIKSESISSQGFVNLVIATLRNCMDPYRPSKGEVMTLLDMQGNDYRESLRTPHELIHLRPQEYELFWNMTPSIAQQLSSNQPFSQSVHSIWEQSKELFENELSEYTGKSTYRTIHVRAVASPQARPSE